MGQELTSHCGDWLISTIGGQLPRPPIVDIFGSQYIHGCGYIVKYLAHNSPVPVTSANKEQVFPKPQDLLFLMKGINTVKEFLKE